MKELRGFVIWGCQEITSLPKNLFKQNTKLEAQRVILQELFEDTTMTLQLFLFSSDVWSPRPSERQSGVMSRFGSISHFDRWYTSSTMALPALMRTSLQLRASESARATENRSLGVHHCTFFVLSSLRLSSHTRYSKQEWSIFRLFISNSIENRSLHCMGLGRSW